MTPLGQIGKRLQIIKIAISITDDETIDMQRSKLKLHKNDKLLDNILSVLDDENYAQASNLIDRYIHGPYDNDLVLEPEVEEDTHDIPMDPVLTEEKNAAQAREEEELIKKFGLFVDKKSKEVYNPIDKDELLTMTQSEATRTVPSEETEEAEKPEVSEESPAINETIEYAPISYIDQKVRNMLNQYPQAEESSEQFESEEKLLYMISLEGYTEADIEKTIDEVFELKKEGKLAESAHLLLIAASTESLYAQFILARELYRGEILQRDLPEAFTQINRLALDEYPEAICDLAQFYERGIGIDKDKKKAFSLYEDALDLGVQRADAHLSRLEEETKGILGKLFGR